MDEPRARGVSLWLMPEGEVRDRLSALVVGLAARLGTAPFPPHVTLLPGLEASDEDVLAASRTLAGGLRPLAVRLVGVEGRDEHFRCLFARAAADAPLRSAHAAAARAFGREPDPAFLPHLSLVYGALAPAAKESLAAELRGEAAVAFQVRRLHVWRTEGPAGDWREIGAFAFPPT
jgi:2'-5' RNA ligase